MFQSGQNHLSPSEKIKTAHRKQLQTTTIGYNFATVKSVKTTLTLAVSTAIQALVLF